MLTFLGVHHTFCLPLGRIAWRAKRTLHWRLCCDRVNLWILGIPKLFWWLCILHYHLILKAYWVYFHVILDWIDSNIVRKNFVFQQESPVSMEQQWESCSLGEYSSVSSPDLLISDQAPNLRVVLTSQLCMCPPEWSVWNTGPWRLCMCWPLCAGTLLLWSFLYFPFTFTSIFNTSHNNYFGNELFGFSFVSGNVEIHCNF